ncbi:hypothetical protein WR25_05070 [Diploscapter pachys]|uniref:Uncharacterized protein n=1 Tax=Diploscapter pachys TaxID=2018661 RepID=A0A2A2K722_9BILA|nr:hypothetical protein WR25_05070 [Diploscapter pachys]
MNSETRTPASRSCATMGDRRSNCPAASIPPSVVRSSRFSGTMHAACGRCFSAMASISSVAAISRLSGTVRPVASRAISSSAEAAAQLERAGGTFDEHRLDAQRTRHLMARDHAAHRGADDRADPCLQFGGNALHQRVGQAGATARVHQHARALQVARAAQARRQDEMPFEQRVRGAEFGQHVVVGHRHSSRTGNRIVGAHRYSVPPPQAPGHHKHGGNA